MSENRTNTPPCVAVIQKWRESYHGVSSNETECVKYLSTKYLICWDTHYYDSDSSDDEYDDYDIIEQIDSALDFADARDNSGQIIPSWSSHVPCIIRKAYYYRDRRFGIRNYGIEKFQKLWKNFHYIKMTRYKAVKYLQYRQLYGKYPKKILH
uniref:Uncharacterized protein n=1 Tax=viral metagenome TaxID=1070528 RepID=A0A6C0J947_9ZZZZ